MTIGAYIPLGSGDRKTHPRGVPYRSWRDIGDDMAARVHQHGYRSAVVWMPHGLDADGSMRFDSAFRITEPECKWMTDARQFSKCWQQVRAAGLQTMWWYTGNAYQGASPTASDYNAYTLRSEVSQMVNLAEDAGFTGLAIDASGNAIVGSTPWLIARYVLRMSNLDVGYEGWADDAHPHWKADVRLHGFSMPRWWREDQASNGKLYGARPLGGRSVLFIDREDKAERTAMAKAIIASGCSVYDDIWHGVRPKDLEASE